MWLNEWTSGVLLHSGEDIGGVCEWITCPALSFEPAVDDLISPERWEKQHDEKNRLYTFLNTDHLNSMLILCTVFISLEFFIEFHIKKSLQF